MILFENWEIRVQGAPCTSYKLHQYDNEVHEIVISGVPDDWRWELLVSIGSHLDIIIMNKDEDRTTIRTLLTDKTLVEKGTYLIQLRGTRDTKIRHTNILRIRVDRTLTGDGHWPEVPTEFKQIEQNIHEMNEHPPIPGENGYWKIWDLDSHSYQESAFPLEDTDYEKVKNKPRINGEELIGDKTGKALGLLDADTIFTIDMSKAVPVTSDEVTLIDFTEAVGGYEAFVGFLSGLRSGKNPIIIASGIIFQPISLSSETLTLIANMGGAENVMSASFIIALNLDVDSSKVIGIVGNMSYSMGENLGAISEMPDYLREQVRPGMYAVDDTNGDSIVVPCRLPTNTMFVIKDELIQGSDATAVWGSVENFKKYCDGSAELFTSVGFVHADKNSMEISSFIDFFDNGYVNRLKAYFYTESGLVLREFEDSTETVRYTETFIMTWDLSDVNYIATDLNSLLDRKTTRIKPDSNFAYPIDEPYGTEYTGDTKKFWEFLHYRDYETVTIAIETILVSDDGNKAKTYVFENCTIDFYMGVYSIGNGKQRVASISSKTGDAYIRVYSNPEYGSVTHAAIKYIEKNCIVINPKRIDGYVIPIKEPVEEMNGSYFGVENETYGFYPKPMGLPKPTAEDAGKVPVVNADGTGYVLKGDRKWTMLGETDCSVVSGNITYNSLDNFTEFLIKAETVKNNSSTDSGYYLNINAKSVSQFSLTINDSSLNTDFIQWVLVRFNGLIWEVTSTPGAVSESNLTNAQPRIPYNYVLDVGVATMFELAAPLPEYRAVSGKITVWGR